mgnify:CR=1 FL=1
MKVKKITLIAALVVAVAGVALAGFDQYTGKNYTTLLASESLGVTQTGASTNAVSIDGSNTNAFSLTTTIAAVTNSTITGVDCSGLVGRGAVVFTLDPGAGGVLSVSLSSCATTNGTYTTITNDQGQSSWSVTNTGAFKVIPVRPNSFSRYWRTTVTQTGCTNASAGAVLVTE